MAKFWFDGTGKVIVDGDGKPRDCADCACDEGGGGGGYDYGNCDAGRIALPLSIRVTLPGTWTSVQAWEQDACLNCASLAGAEIILDRLPACAGRCCTAYYGVASFECVCNTAVPGLCDVDPPEIVGPNVVGVWCFMSTDGSTVALEIAVANVAGAGPTDPPCCSEVETAPNQVATTYFVGVGPPDGSAWDVPVTDAWTFAGCFGDTAETYLVERVT